MEFRPGALAKRDAPDELTAVVEVVPARTMHWLESQFRPSSFGASITS
jgi:hypothetical protein